MNEVTFLSFSNMSSTRKLFEFTGTKEQIDSVKEFFESNEKLEHLNIYKTILNTFIIIAEFNAPIKVTLSEDPFKDLEENRFVKYEKRQAEYAEKHEEIYSWKGAAKPKAKVAKPAKEKAKVATTGIEAKLDRIIELLEQLTKK